MIAPRALSDVPPWKTYLSGIPDKRLSGFTMMNIHHHIKSQRGGRSAILGRNGETQKEFQIGMIVFHIFNCIWLFGLFIVATWFGFVVA